MRAKTIGWAVLVAVVLALLPLAANADGPFDFSDYTLPLPLGSSRPEDGGFYTGLEFILFRQTVPLKDQSVAVRGFYNVNDQRPTLPGAAFYGSGDEALNTGQVRGPGTYDPGFKVYLGWKFEDASVLTLSWMHLFQNRFQAVATPVTPNFNLRPDFADSFITAPVFNYPNDFAGPVGEQAGPVGQNGLPSNAYGIWNGASIMTESFVQRTEAYDLIWRKPVYQTEDYRLSSLMGPRFFWLWEEYKWTTTDFGFAGNAGPSAIYTNIISNRMYGWNFGCSQECYLGHGFAFQLDTNAALFLDVIKERAKYETGTKFAGAAENKRARTDYTVAPELDAKLSLMWYPIDNVQINLGYNIMSFFNTVTSEEPIDFNYSSLTPKYNRDYIRILDGISAAVAIIF